MWDVYVSLDCVLTRASGGLVLLFGHFFFSLVPSHFPIAIPFCVKFSERHQ